MKLNDEGLDLLGVDLRCEIVSYMCRSSGLNPMLRQNVFDRYAKEITLCMTLEYDAECVCGYAYIYIRVA